MTQLKRTIGVCILACALVQAVEAHAATYYVSTSGNNSNSGTSSSPWRTVTYAANKMVAGDTTYVRGGRYAEGTVQFGRSGTSSAPIKLLSAPGEFPVIDFGNKASSKKILFQNYSSYKYRIGWITIEGFEIKNAYNSLKIYNGHDLTIRRNWIHDSASAGISGNGTRILFDRNRINNSGSATTPNHGLYMNGTAITITNNLIYNNYNYGIQLNGSSSSLYNSAVHAGSEFALSANWVIANNTFAYSRNASAMVVWGSTCKNARIENNIFYENAVTASTTATQGVNFIGTSCTGISIRNNLAYASGSGGTKFLGTGAKQGTHYTQSGNIVNTLKPSFVNAPATLPSSPNFALPSGSSAIDKGLVISTAKIAYNGTSRPKGSTYDVGAYEYNGSTSQLLLAAPTSAQAQ